MTFGKIDFDMVKKYAQYITEASKPKFFDVMDIIDKFPGSISIAEKELENLVIGEICIWYTKGNSTLKKQVISEVRVTKTSFGGVNIYFNGFSVDPEFSVEIEQTSSSTSKQKELYDVVGFPSGEVLSLPRDQVQMLLDFGWIRYEQSMFWRDVEYKNIFFFSDKNYHKIREMVDPNYKKPVKSNVSKKEEYNIGDVVVTRGFSEGGVNLDSRIGKIKDKDKKELRYLIQFLMKFSNLLMQGNTLWVSEPNIKGIYTGDLQTQIALANKQRDEDLEEHEVDDDYHIKQIFKNVPGVKSIELDKGDGKNNLVYGYGPKPTGPPKDFEDFMKNYVNDIKIGDEVVISDKRKALYQFDSKEFVDVWFEKGRILGKVVDIKYIDGEKCVQIGVSDIIRPWYKMSCVEK